MRTNIVWDHKKDVLSLVRSYAMRMVCLSPSICGPVVGETLGKGETLRLEFDPLWKQKITFVWKVCQLGLDLIGLSGSQKCRWFDYPLALVWKHSNSEQTVWWSFWKKSTLKYFSAFLPGLTGSADRVLKKKKMVWLKEWVKTKWVKVLSLLEGDFQALIFTMQCKSIRGLRKLIFEGLQTNKRWS